jgi:hypothetical protein
MRNSSAALIGAAFFWAAGAGACFAQDTSQAGPVPVTGNAPTFCTAGSLQGADDVYDLGVLIDINTGFLSQTLAAPPKTLTGAFCNAGSTINIAATSIEAQTVGGTPPSGYSDEVDFTATASGWTTTPASFSTATGATAQSSQTRPTAFSGDIIVAIDNFSTSGGSALRMVADPAYQGSVTVTLAIAN